MAEGQLQSEKVPRTDPSYQGLRAKYVAKYLAQIANSVPNRVQFEKEENDGKNGIIIEGTAFSDQDILKLIDNLSSKSLIAQASLAKMSLPKSTGVNVRKGFTILVKTKR